jgi:hypothetical protein
MPEIKLYAMVSALKVKRERLLMKKFIISALLSLCATFSIQAASHGPINPSTADLPPQGIAFIPEKDALRALDDLIAVTDKSLAEQKQLRRLTVDYFKVKARYLQDQQNKDNVVQMVKSAHQLQKAMESQNLIHVFDAELLDEIKFFSQIASKKGITRP